MWSGKEKRPLGSFASAGASLGPKVVTMDTKPGVGAVLGSVGASLGAGGCKIEPGGCIFMCGWAHALVLVVGEDNEASGHGDLG
jgi:hypothetical protein